MPDWLAVVLNSPYFAAGWSGLSYFTVVFPMRNITFSPPDISDIEIQEVVDTLKSGWITTGPKTKKLEGLLAGYIGTNRTACLSCQTACGEMALRLLGIGEGDEVITTAYTYTATASVIDHVGAKIVMIDCQKDSLEMDYSAMEKAITAKTKAVIPVDLGGVPCDYDRIIEIVESKKHLFTPSSHTQLGQRIQQSIGRVAVLADSAHGLGAAYKGRMTGQLADFTSFSFHAVKNFTTAEGGALTWKPLAGIDDEEIYHQIQLYSLHGQSKDAYAKTRPGSWEYDIVGPWYKCNMTDIMASIGIGQFSRYPGMLEKRKKIIGMYDSALKPLGIKVLPHFTDTYQSSGHLYITLIPGITAEQRNDIIVKMAERGIATNVHYKPLPMHTAYKNLGFNIEDFPNAYSQFAREVTLPLNTVMSLDDVDYIIENYMQVLQEYITII